MENGIITWRIWLVKESKWRSNSRSKSCSSLLRSDSTVAHTAGEYLDRAPLERVWAVLDRLVREGPDS